MKNLVNLLLTSIIFIGTVNGKQLIPQEGQEHFSKSQTVIYVIIGVVLLVVIFSVLWKRQKRKFNE